MSKFGAVLAGIMLIVGTSAAQPPKETPKLDPNDPLDSLLMKWEKTMTGTESFLAKNCARIEKGKTGTKTYQGEIRFLKPGYFGLKMVQTQNPKIYELFVCTGNRLYDYRPQSKRLVIHELPAGKTGAMHGVQQLLLGMTAAGIKRQFDVRLIPGGMQVNPDFVTIEIKPRNIEDKRAFSQVQVVLWAKSMLPRRLTIEQSNGDEVIWDLPNVDTETKLKPADFTPPKAPADWEQQTAPRTEPSRP
jgi:TIGR03009 family protein